MKTRGSRVTAWHSSNLRGPIYKEAHVHCIDCNLKGPIHEVGSESL